jgi:hypothetical protein
MMDGDQCWWKEGNDRDFGAKLQDWWVGVGDQSGVKKEKGQGEGRRETQQDR